MLTLNEHVIVVGLAGTIHKAGYGLTDDQDGSLVMAEFSAAALIVWLAIQSSKSPDTTLS